MAITSITIQQDNRIGAANLLAAQSQISFIANVNYSGTTPDEVNVELRDSLGELIETYRAIAYRDTLATQRQFVFQAAQAVRSLLGEFDDFSQLVDTLQYVDGLTRQLFVRFVDPENANTYAEVIMDFAHAARQFGEGCNMEDQYNNDTQLYLAPKDGIVYVYFYNENESNNLSTNLVASMTVQPQILEFNDVTVSTNSASIPVEVVGTGLTGNIVVTPPANFEVSLDDITFYSSLNLVPTAGVVIDTVYVRFSPTAVQSYSGNVTFVSPGVSTINVAVSGEGIAVASPVISSSLSNIDFGSVTENTHSAGTSVVVTGANMVDDVIINAPTGFSLSLDDVLYLSQVTLLEAGGVVNDTIYIRFDPTTVQGYSGNVVLASTGAANLNISVQGIGIAALNPTITLYQTNYNFGDVLINSTANPTTCLVVGTDLSTPITVTSQTGFKVSLDNINYLDTVDLPAGGGTVWINFTPTAVQSYSANIAFNATGAVTQYFAASGAGIENTQPVIGINPNNLYFGQVPIYTSSSILTFELSGQYLTGDAFMAAPTGFVVSLDGILFQGALTVPEVGGIISATIYVRFDPTLTQFYEEFMVISAGGASDISCQLLGQGI